MNLLVIPTYNRSAKLQRVLDWYRSEGLKARVVILDASSEPVHQEGNRKAVASCGGFAQHIPTPGQDDVAQRIYNFLESVDDDVFAVGNDEDAYFPEFLGQAFELLRSDPSYVLAAGRYVTSARPLLGMRRITYWTDRFLSLDVDEAEPALRVINFQRLNGGGVPPLYWSVRRKSAFLESCRLAHGLRTGSAHELIDQINSCVLGKISISAYPMLLRDESRVKYQPGANRDDGRLYIGADDLERIEQLAAVKWERDVGVAVRAVTSWYRAKSCEESYQSRLNDTSYCGFSPPPDAQRRPMLRWLQGAIRGSCVAGILLSQVFAYAYFLVYMSKSGRGRRFLKMTRTLDVNKAG